MAVVIYPMFPIIQCYFLQKFKKTINAMLFNRYGQLVFPKDEGEQIYMTERKIQC
jgi:hypothetical protein